MEKCPHIRSMSICRQDSILNPRNWNCNDCGTTESVWACLTCSHFACGRAAHGHSIKHFDITNHPLAIEVNEKYVHCYLCDDWILNDTITSDVSLLQSLLEQVAAQNYQESRTRSGRVLRPATGFMRMESRVEQVQSRIADKKYTALCHYKFLVLSKTFNEWKEFVKISKLEVKTSVPTVTSSAPLVSSSCTTTASRRRLITPGMTGLRNLGNTCYMNAALQALGHLQFLRETFRQMGQTNTEMTSHNSSVLFNRQTTVECFQHMSTKPPKFNSKGMTRQTGLSGGGGGKTKRTTALIKTCTTQEELGTLCEEIHGLMRVMWSGKWAIVTPHTILTAIWHHIPTFRGYCQQDAQEFLCELLDQLQSELLQCPSELNITITNPTRDVVPARDLLKTLFEGQLTSIITYNECKHQSTVTESFWDLSLEFPPQNMSDKNKRSTPSSCTLQDILSHFTTTELINENIFECSQCNRHHQSVNKQLLLSYPPEVLRLHLKRFRYNHPSWHKISSHVTFPMELNTYNYCLRSTTITQQQQSSLVYSIFNDINDYIYDLTSVIVHHGTGFTSGHYTAYCWNNDAGSWVHCNDARLSRTSPDEVLKCQAYVLFYARRTGRSPVLNRQHRNEEELPPAKYSKRL